MGASHAPQTLREAAKRKWVEITNDPSEAGLIFVSEDTPTDAEGNRDLTPIRELCAKALTFKVPVVLTSQVPPGFTRSMGIKFHQAETLRMKDALERALNPEMMIVGNEVQIPPVYMRYLKAFNCPILTMGLEEAEFAKIAINRFLIAQVETTNELANAAKKCGVNWEYIKDVLQHDSRIGPHAYLNPGRWQDSKHLLRDYVWLKS